MERKNKRKKKDKPDQLNEGHDQLQNQMIQSKESKSNAKNKVNIEKRYLHLGCLL